MLVLLELQKAKTALDISSKLGPVAHFCTPTYRKWTTRISYLGPYSKTNINIFSINFCCYVKDRETYELSTTPE